MKVLFFASLREQLETSVEHWPDLKNCQTVSDVKDLLVKRGEPWSSAISNPQIIIAVNHEVSSLDTTLSDSDELAFYPPVTGG